MVSSIKSWCLFGGCALVLLQACKTNTAADVQARVPFELLDSGREPRALLRYSIPDGTTTTATTKFSVSPQSRGETTTVMAGLRSLEIKAVLGPARNRGDEILYDYEITRATAVVAPGASREARQRIEQSAASLRGAGATASINDRGRFLSSSMNERAMEVPARVLVAIVNTDLALSQIVLPEEEVGIGARWIVRNEIVVYGLRMEQDLSFTLVERTDDGQVVVDVVFERLGRPQVVELPDGETSVEVLSSRTSGTGRIQLDLRSFRSSARATGRVTDAVIVVHQGTREKREINEDFDIRVDSTSRIVGTDQETPAP